MPGLLRRGFILGAFAAACSPALGQVLSARPAAPERPQTPRPPFPYRDEAVGVTSRADGARLAGTLTIPDRPGRHPAVVLLGVAGPNDRDMSYVGHRAFAVLADRLTREGFAVLRLDDRGVGQSQGDWMRASYEVLAQDASSAVAFLSRRPDINRRRVGIAGVSEGCAIAGMAAAGSPSVAFTVLFSPPGLPGSDTLREQLEATLRATAAPEALAAAYRAAFQRFLELSRQASRDTAAMGVFEAFLAGEGKALVPPYGFVPRDPSGQATLFAGPWYQSQLDYRPQDWLGRIHVPVLVVGGTRDRVLPPAIHHPPLRAGLARTDAQFVMIDGTNHLLQPAQTGLPDEYARIATTIDPRILDAVSGWLARKVRR